MSEAQKHVHSSHKYLHIFVLKRIFVANQITVVNTFVSLSHVTY